MHNGHRKQAARDWVKKGQKGRPQTGGVRENMKSLQARYLDRLAELYPTIAAASTEIINLESILNLPKGTEHFLTDIHGEYEAFSHVLKNGSGSVKRKIDDVFGNTLSRQDKQSLATLIYYPAEKMSRILQTEKNPDDWYKITLYRLIAVCRRAASKYTRSKIRKALPKEFAYVLEELLTERGDLQDKESYYDAIVQTIVRVGRAKAFIIALSELIQRLTVDHLHIVGDIYDRGPGAHIIMDTLCNYHNFDIQWGNHDILWMGAASGNDSCIANVIRMSMRYGNLGTLEDGYGINLLPLATFAMDTYADDPCTIFMPKMNFADTNYNEKTLRLITQMHKAITIIQFKLEAEIIDRRPEFGMANRKLLEKIDFERGVFVYEGKEYALRDTNFPTVDPADPYRLTEEERELVEKIHYSFMNSEKLKKHMRCLFTYGGMYLVSNSNLLYHASVPLNEDGSFKHVKIRGKEYWGRKLLDKADQLIRTAYFDEEGEEDKEFAMDYIWYMWCGPEAPLFDKDKMATFERYFVEDKELHKEKKGYYYTLRNREDICDQILTEFGASGPHSHIINGHVPVKTIQGEQPMKANGKLFVIDGGFSKAYQPETGIAGYTLVYHSHGMQLVQHEPFQSRQKAIEEGLDIKSTNFVLEFNSQRMMVKDTDKGKELVTQIQDLKKLLVAYRTGLIKEKV